MMEVNCQMARKASKNYTDPDTKHPAENSPTALLSYKTDLI